MTGSVLDSWALIAWLPAEEPAGAAVQEILDRASRGRSSTQHVGDQPR